MNTPLRPFQPNRGLHAAPPRRARARISTATQPRRGCPTGSRSYLRCQDMSLTLRRAKRRPPARRQRHRETPSPSTPLRRLEPHAARLCCLALPLAVRRSSTDTTRELVCSQTGRACCQQRGETTRTEYTPLSMCCGLCKRPLRNNSMIPRNGVGSKKCRLVLLKEWHPPPLCVSLPNYYCTVCCFHAPLCHLDDSKWVVFFELVRKFLSVQFFEEA